MEISLEGRDFTSGRELAPSCPDWKVADIEAEAAARRKKNASSLSGRPQF
jgi:hypothetical protein